MLDFLIYGANGYTGTLIAREAVRQGLRPILAGRNAATVNALADELGLNRRVFTLEDAPALNRGLEGSAVVLNCAGPFSRTAHLMAEACLRARAHYLDITGEEAVFDALAVRDAEARERGVMLLPGVGFDVVPSDCLAAHLKRRLPSATRLTLAFKVQTKMSRGTTLTVIEGLADGGGIVRDAGILKRVPAAWKTRLIDFGEGPEIAMTIPWGDVVTAFYSTGIPNIEVYMAVSRATRVAARLSRNLRWLLGSRFVQRWLVKRVAAGPAGPSDDERKKGKSFLWGEAADDAGRTVVSRLAGPESYDWTVQTALAVVRRVLNGVVVPGFQTPSRVFGADFVLENLVVTRSDERP